MGNLEQLAEKISSELWPKQLTAEVVPDGVRSGDISTVAPWLSTVSQRLQISGPGISVEPGWLNTIPRIRELGPYKISYTSERLSVAIGDDEQWIIDTKSFGGTPILETTVEDTGATIELSNAFYPGTKIPADLRAIIRLDANEWRIRIRLKFGSFDATCKLGSWLKHDEVAISGVILDQTCCALGTDGALKTSGKGLAYFGTHWVLALAGWDLLQIEGFAQPLSADLAVIAPLPSTLGSLFPVMHSRRTGIVLLSDHRFALKPRMLHEIPNIKQGQHTFRFLAIEAILDETNQARRAFLAFKDMPPVDGDTEDAIPYKFLPGGDLWGDDGERFSIPLKNCVYIAVYDDASIHITGFFGMFPRDNIQWLHAPGCSLLLSPYERRVALVIESHDEQHIDVSDFIVQKTALYPGETTAVTRPEPRPVGPLFSRIRIAQQLTRLGRIPEPDIILSSGKELLVKPTKAPANTVLTFHWAPPTAVPEPNRAVVYINARRDTASINLPQDLTLSMVRRSDFLKLDFQFLGLRYKCRGNTRHLLRLAGQTPHLLVSFPPQSIGEEAFFETDDFPIDDTVYTSDGRIREASPLSQNNLPDPPVKALFAKPSRLVFRIPAALRRLPFTMDRLLNWMDLTPSLAPTALPSSLIVRPPMAGELSLPGGGTGPRIPGRFGAPPGLPGAVRGRNRFAPELGGVPIMPQAQPRLPTNLGPQEPSATTTVIEMPFRLLLSPSKIGQWAHAREAVTHDGWTELWHTRLGTRTAMGVFEGTDPNLSVRAIWSRDYSINPMPAEDSPFLMSLNADDRRQLVHLTADFTRPNDPPKAVMVNRFMLSPLGSWFDAGVQFDSPAYSMEEWLHRATQGRDHYVRVVYKGHLLPFGHQASVVKITERKIQFTKPDGEPSAYLRQRVFLVVREPEKEYPVTGAGSREMPFKRIRITTLVTPNLDSPKSTTLGSSNNPPNPSLAAFWPYVDQQPFLFQVQARDWENRDSDFAMPMAFLRDDQPIGYGKFYNQYNVDTDDAGAALRTARLDGQRVAFAAVDGESLGQTTLETEKLNFKVMTLSGWDAPLYPRLDKASVYLPAIRQIMGRNETTSITLEPYIEKDFEDPQNVTKVFAKINPSAPLLDYASGGNVDKAGAVATPSLAIRGLSRSHGVVGDVSPEFMAGHFRPAKFFEHAMPKLLGSISLAEIVNDTLGELDKVPRLVTSNQDEIIQSRLHWSTSALTQAAGFIPNLSGQAATLALDSVWTTDKGSGDQSYSLSGKLSNFTLAFAGVVEVGFKHLHFSAAAASKPDLQVGIKHMEFTGDLAFINAVVSRLSLKDFGDPPYVDVSPNGIATGYSLTLPSVAVGVFALQNLALGARLMLPLVDQPARLRFNLSERHNPFIVSVGPFGGGGFFALAVGLDGVETVEVVIEFGGNVALNLGVASGGVYVMAGIYIAYALDTGNSNLTGYLRAGGGLQVLGLVTISVEFYLGLTYDKPKAWGEASVRVKVKVVFVSKTVRLTVRREFASNSGDPDFMASMSLPQWQAYANAFATEGMA